jgi:hypothetical protein
MGRSVASIRQRVKGIAERWEQAARVLAREDDRSCGEALAGLVKMHSSDVFYGCNEPLEAAVFSALVEIVKARAACTNPGQCQSRNPAPGTGAGAACDRVTGPGTRPGTGQEFHVDP